MSEAKPKVHDAGAERIMTQMSNAARLEGKLANLVTSVQEVFNGLRFLSCISDEQRQKIKKELSGAFAHLVDARSVASKAHFDRMCDMWKKLEDYFYTEPPKEE